MILLLFDKLTKISRILSTQSLLLFRNNKYTTFVIEENIVVEGR